MKPAKRLRKSRTNHGIYDGEFYSCIYLRMNGKKIRTNYECQTVMATGQWQHRKNIKRNNNYIRITFFFIVSIRLLNGKSKGEEKKNSFLNLVVVCFSHQTQQLLSKPERLSFVSMTEKLNIHFCGIWNANEWPKPNAFKRQTKYSKQIFCIIANKRFFFFIFIFCISHSCICLLSTFFNNGS